MTTANNAKAIGQRLARIRKERGFTQVELAAKLGVSQNAITAYERGVVRLNAIVLNRIADIIGATADEILGRTDKKELAADAKPTRRVLRRLRAIEKLPKRKQSALLNTIDTFIKGAKA